MNFRSYLLNPATVFLLGSLAAACGDSGSSIIATGGGGGGANDTTGGGGGAPDGTPPTVVFTSPLDGAMDVPMNTNVSATFSEAIDVDTLVATSFVLTQAGVPVVGLLTYAGTVATFDPAVSLTPNSEFLATVTTAVADLQGNTLAFAKSWTFKTGNTVASGPPPVNLGTSGGFLILAKSGIVNVPPSVLTGNIGVSPIDGTGMTGFSLAMDSTNAFSTSPQLTGVAYAADYASPTPSNLTTAVGNMEAAYTDAAGRPSPDFTELASGDISGLTLVPGLYKWGTGLLIATDVTLAGGPNDVWIFQISGGITQESGAAVLLTGGAQPKNVFWQAFGSVTLGTGAHLEGIVLSQTEITFATGASANSRLLSQTAVTLDASTVTQPPL